MRRIDGERQRLKIPHQSNQPDRNIFVICRKPIRHLQKIAHFLNASPFQKDRMNLPVANVKEAIPFYQNMLGFTLLSITSNPVNLALLQRDQIQIGLAENGGDPTQDGCFFEVDDVNLLHKELTGKFGEGQKNPGAISGQNQNGVPWRMFFVVAPDGLCYCFGQKA